MKKRTGEGTGAQLHHARFTSEWGQDSTLFHLSARNGDCIGVAPAPDLDTAIRRIRVDLQHQNHNHWLEILESGEWDSHEIPCDPPITFIPLAGVSAIKELKSAV